MKFDTIKIEEWHTLYYVKKGENCPKILIGKTTGHGRSPESFCLLCEKKIRDDKHLKRHLLEQHSENEKSYIILAKVEPIEDKVDGFEYSPFNLIKTVEVIHKPIVYLSYGKIKFINDDETVANVELHIESLINVTFFNGRVVKDIELHYDCISAQLGYDEEIFLRHRFIELITRDQKRMLKKLIMKDFCIKIPWVKTYELNMKPEDVPQYDPKKDP